MRNLHVSVGLLSVALIAFQLLLMQIFSIVQWYHFAYMVISVALLGFGASGTLISLAREWLLKRVDFVVPLTMIASGAAMAGVTAASQLDWIRFDSYLVFVEGAHVRALVFTYLGLSVPFFFGALALGLVFVRHVNQIGSIYFANLLGSGLGGLLAVAVLWFLLPQNLPPLIALFPIGAGLLVLPKKRKVLLLLTALFAFTLSIYFVLEPPRLIPSQYKGLSRVLNLPDAKIVLERSSPYGLVQVVSSPALRYAPGLSVRYQLPVPVRDVVFNNGDWFGPIATWSHIDTTHLLDYTTAGLPYIMERRNRVLVLQARTGMHVAHAVTHGAQQVIAVEPHSNIISLLRHEYARATDSLLYHPVVSLHILEPRTYIATSTSNYDLIVLPTLDAFGGTAGLYALQEQYSLTKEAFRDMWEHLTTDGVISISSWMDYPIRNPLKALATLVEVLSEAGVEDPVMHITAVRSWGMITFVAKRTPLTDKEVQKVREFCRRMLFDPALLPHLEPGERVRYNQWEDETFFEYLDAILSAQRTTVYRDYDFSILPATDDRPYFSQFLRWQGLVRLKELYGQHAMPFLEIGYLIVAVTLVQIFIVAIILIILPLVRGSGRSKTWTLLYFASLGVGYMFVEIVLIQRFILYFGHPIYATAAVIGAMLVCSGVGSYVSSRLTPTVSLLWKISSLALLLITVYAFSITPILQHSMSLPIQWKAVLSFLLIAPGAFLMGIPFPLGLRYLSEQGEAQIAWAWGINGCMSVVSTALATIVAVDAGFFVVMVCAAGMYGLAALVTKIQSSN